MDYANLNTEEMWDLLENYCCSEETIRVVTSINGYSKETMLDILYATTGLRSFEQLADEYGLIEEEYDDDDYEDEEY